MKVSQSSVVIASFFVVSFVHIANAINCFQCNSKNNPECSNLHLNDTNSRFYLPCENEKPDEPSFCRKSVLKVLMDYEAGPKQTRVIRSCGYRKDEKNRVCYKKANKDHEEIHCQCFTDGCNIAASHHKLHLLIIAPLIAISKF